MSKLLPFGIFSILISYYLTTCTQHSTPQKESSPFESFAGTMKCRACHQAIVDSFVNTNHFKTSSAFDETRCLGSFEYPLNTYRFSPILTATMERRDSGHYQVFKYKGEEKLALKIDVITGSGIRGQSFLSKKGSELYQLPMTYFTTAHTWANSPGFPSNKVVINKLITSRCLECHVTYATQTKEGNTIAADEFNTDQIVFGVGCEKCHGPGSKHVDFHSQHPAETKPRHIINPGALSKNKNLDLCASCHSGNIEKIKPSFGFKVGDDLKNFFKINELESNKIESGNIDVHGNQYGLLTASTCFKNSDMTCRTCHEPHRNTIGQLQRQSVQCMNCHDPSKIQGLPTHTRVKNLSENCIDCHMPLQKSRAITLFLEGAEVPSTTFIRSHYIGIYTDEVEKYLKEMKTN